MPQSDPVSSIRIPQLEPFHTADSISARTNPWAIGSAALVNGAILALVLSLGLNRAFPPTRDILPNRSHIDVSNYPLLAMSASNGGNGAGSSDLIDPIKGRLPDRSSQTLAPPQVPLLENPRLRINSTIPVPLDVKLPDNPNLPNVGVFSSPNVSLASNGPSGPTGIGTGRDGTYGAGNDNGLWGPGNGPGIQTPGVNGVSQPIPIVTPEAEFSDEARRAKYQGVCLISIIVDTQGNPQAPRIVQRLGMGLDEKALDAVRRYKFRPALRNGKPVPVRLTVAVNFRLF